MPPTQDFRLLSLTAAVMLLLVAWSTGVGAATLQVAGPPGATVRLNDRSLGMLPLTTPVDLAPGVYELACRARGYHDLTETVILADPESRLVVRLRPLPLARSQAVKSSLLYAGLGQWYNGAKLRGWIYFLGESGGLLTALAGELQRQNRRDDYTNAKSEYDRAILQGDIEYWRAQAASSYRDLQDMESLRNTGLYVAAGAWVLSLLDAWLLFPSVDLGPGLVPPSPNAATTGARTGVYACLSFGFSL
ncbi:MAG: PEGA domain-containing protein [Candidatus Krumholzibacteria bacterium]|jgi:hypothetical protein|nr:PEGA domain-containing protein [Candidatus Krumholzibacteria bacterium]